jgi:hypothetical protein
MLDERMDWFMIVPQRYEATRCGVWRYLAYEHQMVLSLCFEY